MSLKKYLITMTLATFFCWLAWLIVLYYINPVEAGFVGFLFFYLSLLLALWGSFSLIGFFGRVWFSSEHVIFRHLGVSTRQAFWLSALGVGLLILQSNDFLRWWLVLLLVLFLGLLEFFFLSRKIIRH